MKPDVRAYIADALDAADGIERRMRGVVLEAFLENEDLRLIVERLYITLAEALNAAGKIDPTALIAAPKVSELIAFRNILVHRYRRINPIYVHGITQAQRPMLKAKLGEILASLDAQ